MNKFREFASVFHPNFHPLRNANITGEDNEDTTLEREAIEAASVE
jgi:hypothetical protein